MTSEEASIDAILQRAASDLTIPTPVAQVLMMIGAELLDQRRLVAELRAATNKNIENINHVRKDIAKLKGVHGA